MKNFLGGAERHEGSEVTKRQVMLSVFGQLVLFYGMLILLGVLIYGCKKQQDVSAPLSCAPAQSDNALATEGISQGAEVNTAMDTDDEFRRNCGKLNWQTTWELLQARAATVRYRNINYAIRDGYADIEVRVENMGYHYMKAALKDDKFDPRKPEILVYNKKKNGTYVLVAVEYAIPIEDTPNKAPRGFTGDADVWDRNTGFGLWLLHAWVWHKNPDGVFNPTNPLIRLH